MIVNLCCGKSTISEEKIKKVYAKKRDSIFSKLNFETLPLKRIFSFPDNEVIIEIPRKICIDNSNFIYLLDSRACCIFVFDSDGNYMRRIGRSGQGPGEFLTPIDMDINNNKIIINDLQNGRIQILHISGELINSFLRMRSYHSICFHNNGNIFASRFRAKPGDSAIDEISIKGELIKSFGKTEYGNNNTYCDNVFLTSNDEEIYAAYKFIARINKYDSHGQKYQEFSVNHYLLKEKQSHNLNSKNGYKPVFDSINFLDNKIFLMINNAPCFQILILDKKGIIEKALLWEEEIPYYAKDFVVQKTGNEYVYYVIQIYPKIKVDVFSQKKASSEIKAGE